MTQEKRLKDAKAAAKEGDIRVFRIMVGGMIPGVTLRYTPGYEPLASLGRSTFQVVKRCLFFAGVFFLAFETEDVGCVDGEVCFDDDFC